MAEEDGNLGRTGSVELAVTQLSEKKLSSSPRFMVDRVRDPVVELPAQALCAGGSWWVLYHLLPPALFP